MNVKYQICKSVLRYGSSVLNSVFQYKLMGENEKKVYMTIALYEIPDEHFTALDASIKQNWKTTTYLY